MEVHNSSCVSFPDIISFNRNKFFDISYESYYVFICKSNKTVYML